MQKDNFCHDYEGFSIDLLEVVAVDCYDIEEFYDCMVQTTNLVKRKERTTCYQEVFNILCRLFLPKNAMNL